MISHEKWLEKVDNELKGKKTTQDLIHTYPTGLTLDPTAPSESFNHELKSFPKELKVGVVTSQTSTSEELVSLLKIGVNTLIYDDPTTTSEKYREVVADYLHIITESADHQASRKKIWPDLINPSVISGTSHISETNLWQNSAQLLSAESEPYIRVVLSDDILYNISVVRAIRWVAEKLGKKVTLIGEATVDGEENEKALIQASAQAMSFRIGGGDIFLPPSEETSTTQLKRYVHIINIMAMESSMNATIDPSRGSYTIESLTAQAIKKIEEAAPA